MKEETIKNLKTKDIEKLKELEEKTNEAIKLLNKTLEKVNANEK